MNSQRGLIGWIVFIFLILLIVLGIFLISSSSNSLPGDLIYPVKQIKENLRLSVYEINFESRANIYVDLSEERFNELEKLIKMTGKDKEIVETSKRLLAQQRRALENIQRARSRAVNVAQTLDRLDDDLKTQQQFLTEFVFQVVGPTADALQQALNESNQISEQINIIKGTIR